MRPGDEVDEIRITARDGSASHTLVVATWRGHLLAGTGAAAALEPPAWVAEMNSRGRQEQDQALRAQMSKPTSPGDMLLFGGFMLAMLAWRIAAAVPAAAMAFVALRILVGVARDPTSHNLWPFEILQVGAFSTVVMGVLLMVRRLSGAGR